MENIFDKKFKITFPLAIDEIRALMGSFVVGYVSLVNGTATINDARISTDSLALVSRKTSSGTLGHLYANVDNGVLTITSTSSSETSQVFYMVIPYAIIAR